VKRLGFSAGVEPARGVSFVSFYFSFLGCNPRRWCNLQTYSMPASQGLC